MKQTGLFFNNYAESSLIEASDVGLPKAPKSNRKLVLLTSLVLSFSFLSFAARAADKLPQSEEDKFNNRGYTTLSTPVVSGNYVYFQGTNNELFKAPTDGSGDKMRLGKGKIKSSPFVYKDYVYYQGADSDENKLMKINSNAGSDELPTPIGGVTRLDSSPFVYSDDYIYFQGINGGGLYRIDTNGSGEQQQINNNTTKSSPFVYGGYVYFQGTDNPPGLWRVDTNGSGPTTKIGTGKLLSSPYVSDGYVYYIGTDNALYRIDSEASKDTGALKLYSDTYHNCYYKPFIFEKYIYFMVEIGGIPTASKLVSLNISSGYGNNLLFVSDGQAMQSPYIDEAGDYAYFHSPRISLKKAPTHSWCNLYVGFYLDNDLNHDNAVSIDIKTNYVGGEENDSYYTSSTTTQVISSNQRGFIEAISAGKSESIKGSSGSGRVSGRGKYDDSKGKNILSKVWSVICKYSPDGTTKKTASAILNYTAESTNDGSSDQTISLSQFPANTQISLLNSYVSAPPNPNTLTSTQFYNGANVYLFFSLGL